MKVETISFPLKPADKDCEHCKGTGKWEESDKICTCCFDFSKARTEIEEREFTFLIVPDKEE